MKTYAYALCAMLALQGAVLADAATKTEHASKVKSMWMSGTVVSTDAVGNTIVVKGKKDQDSFSVPATAKIEEGKKTVALADVSADSHVSIKYTEANGQKEASLIKIHPAHKTGKMKMKKAEADSAK